MFTYLGLLKFTGYFLSVYSTGQLFQEYVFGWSIGSGPSMYPTMPSEESVVFISLLHRRGRGVRVGDVIQAKHPNLVNMLVGKRVIGLPGDYVVYDPDRSPTVGGAPTPLHPRGGADEDNDEGKIAEPMMVQVPEGHVWVAGDNLAWSRDSRFYGPLPMALIRGKAIALRTTGWGLNLRWLGADREFLPSAGTTIEQEQEGAN